MHENYVSETTHWIKQEENNPMMHMHHVKEIKKAQISVVIPARNEEKTVGFVIESSKLACDEVIVVDGHSIDETVGVAKQYGARIVNDNGKGKGDAMRVGAEEASNEILVFIDADGSHNPLDIPRLVEPIQFGNADIVIGSRGRGGSDELHGDLEKLIRMVGSDIIMIGINWRFRSYLTDSQNGFRAIKRDVFLELGLKENITTIEQEMTMKALKKGYIVCEVPTHEYARIYGNSSIKLRKVWIQYIFSFLKNLI